VVGIVRSFAYNLSLVRPVCLKNLGALHQKRPPDLSANDFGVVFQATVNLLDLQSSIDPALSLQILCSCMQSRFLSSGPAGCTKLPILDLVHGLGINARSHASRRKAQSSLECF